MITKTIYTPGIHHPYYQNICRVPDENSWFARDSQPNVNSNLQILFRPIVYNHFYSDPASSFIGIPRSSIHIGLFRIK